LCKASHEKKPHTVPYGFPLFLRIIECHKTAICDGQGRRLHALRALHTQPNRFSIKALLRALHGSFLGEKISIAKNRGFASQVPLYTSPALN
jgi:hypothetical protein